MQGMGSYIVERRRVYLSYAVFIVLYGVANMFMGVGYGDDAVIRSKYLADFSQIPAYVLDIYEKWSTPHVLFIVFCVLLLLPSVFGQLFNWAVTLSLLWALDKLVNPGGNIRVRYFIGFAFMLYPLNQMMSAGWLMTLSVYWWPVAFGVVGFLGTAKLLRGERVRVWEWCLYSLCTFLGTGNWQFVCVLFGLYAVLNAYWLVSCKKVSFALMVQLLLCVGTLVFYLTAPGMSTRYTTENQFFVDFGVLNLLEKVQQGFTATVAPFVADFNMPALLLYLLLAVAVFVGDASRVKKILACIPAGILLLFGFLPTLSSGLFPNVSGVLRASHKEVLNFMQITPFTHNQTGGYVAILITFLMMGCVLASLLHIFKDWHKAVFSIVVLLAGLASRLILSFSPTLYRSGMRTFVFFYLAVLFVAMLVAAEIWEKIPKRVAVAGLAVMGGLGILNLLDKSALVTL